MRPLKQHKKGIMLKTLIGVIIGAVLLLGSLQLVANVLKNTSTPKDQIYKLKGNIASIAADVNGARQTPTVKLQEGDAIIGLNPIGNQSERNGLLNDGDLHIILNKRWTGESYKAETLNGKTRTGSYHDAVHFKRPASCKDNESCLCLCQRTSVTTGTLDQAYKQGLDIDKQGPLPHLYEQALWQEAYVRPFKDHGLIECKQLLCEEIESARFFTPLTAEDFGQRPEKVANPLRSAAHWVGGLFKGQLDLKELPFLLYENGFILYSADSKEDPFPHGYSTYLPENIPLTLAKVRSGRVAVCLTADCITRINAEILTEKGTGLTDDEARKKCKQCTGQEGPVEAQICALQCGQVNIPYP